MFKQDFYKTYKQSLQHNQYSGQKNQRYSSFNQTHYTAGDEEQFLAFMKSKSNPNPKPDPDPNPKPKNLYTDNYLENICKLDLYSDIENLDVNHTFQYIFHKSNWKYFIIFFLK